MLGQPLMPIYASGPFFRVGSLAPLVMEAPSGPSHGDRARGCNTTIEVCVAGHVLLTFAGAMSEPRPHAVDLDQLREGLWAEVADVQVPREPAAQQVVLRLLELGFVPGERVRVVCGSKTPHDPLAVRLGHTTFALRRQEAAFILVKPLS